MLEVYLDVVLIENVVVNFIILMLTRRIARAPGSDLRLFISSWIGGAYVLILLYFQNTPGLDSFLMKAAIALIMTRIAFKYEGTCEFLKRTGIFFLISFLFAGFILATLYCFEGGGILQGGIYMSFWQSSIGLILCSIFLIAIIIRIFFKFVQYKYIKEDFKVIVKIFVDKEEVEIIGLVDTGNFLCDPITKEPVIIVESEKLGSFLSGGLGEEFGGYLKKDFIHTFMDLSSKMLETRLRLIPFHSIGSENGMMIGFKPDCVTVQSRGHLKTYYGVLIGICRHKLSRQDEYNALLSCDLL